MRRQIRLSIRGRAARSPACELVQRGVDGVFEQYGARKRSTDLTTEEKLGARDHLLVLRLIAEPRTGLRPGRIDPPALKRRANAYSLLIKPRKVARTEVREHGHPKKQR